MKTVGIIGGVGPESTIEYYRLIIATYRDRQSGTGVPPVNHAQDARATIKNKERSNDSGYWRRRLHRQRDG